MISPLSFASEAVSGVNSASASGLFYRLAMVLNLGFLTLSEWMAAIGVVLFLGGCIMWANSEKTNLPKQLGMVVAFTGILMGSIHGCQRMGAQEFFQVSEVESLESAREFESNGYLESNGE